MSSVSHALPTSWVCVHEATDKLQLTLPSLYSPSTDLSCCAASVVRLLLMHGAELEVVNFNQETPLDCAHSRVKEVLFHRKASISHKSTSSASNTLPLVSVRVGCGEGDEGEWVGVEVRGRCDGEAEVDGDLVCMTVGRKEGTTNMIDHYDTYLAFVCFSVGLPRKEASQKRTRQRGEEAVNLAITSSHTTSHAISSPPLTQPG